jgi:hypothetical protein
MRAEPWSFRSPLPPHKLFDRVVSFASGLPFLEPSRGFVHFGRCVVNFERHESRFRHDIEYDI